MALPHDDAAAFVTLTPEQLPLGLMYTAERKRGSDPLFTQPFDGGQLKEWTWTQAMNEVRRIAAWLVAKNYPPGSRIVIYSRNCAWWIMADFAIWMAGHVSTPFFSVVREASLVALFEHSQPVACFIGALDAPLPLGEPVFQALDFISFPNAAPAHIPHSATHWDYILANQPTLEGNPQRAGNDLATIIYTSGTTGTPKGVMHTFQSLALCARAQAPALLHKKPRLDRVLSYLPLAHISERSLTEMNLLFIPMHIFFTEGLQTFLVDLKRAKATLFTSVPRLYLKFQQGVWEKMPEKKLSRLLSIPLLGRLIGKKVLTGLGLDHVRVASSGSAPLPADVVRWFRRLHLNFGEGYGMTETGITHIPAPNVELVGYVGVAAPFADTRISTDGEVQVKGPMNMLGYYRNPELTAASFTEDGYFHTGDRGQVDELKRLRIIGRLKEEFKTAKGKYVAPAQIEKLLAISPLFESVAVFGSGMVSPFAITVLVPDLRAECSAATAREEMENKLQAELTRVNALLEHHERLRFLVVSQQAWSSDNNFLTPTLKVKRRVIEDSLGGNFERWENSQQTVHWIETL